MSKKKAMESIKKRYSQYSDEAKTVKGYDLKTGKPYRQRLWSDNNKETNKRKK